jgi:hypothetical protein
MFALSLLRSPPAGASAPINTRAAGSAAWIAGYAARTIAR